MQIMKHEKSQIILSGALYYFELTIQKHVTLCFLNNR